MIELYEEKINLLLNQKDALESKIFSSGWKNKQQLLQTLKDAKVILSNPLFVRQLDSLELKRLMLNVIFNGNITYTEKGGLQTPQIPLVYSSLSIFDGNNSCPPGMAENFTNPVLEKLIDSIWQIKPLVDYLKYHHSSVI